MTMRTADDLFRPAWRKPLGRTKHDFLLLRHGSGASRKHLDEVVKDILNERVSF